MSVPLDTALSAAQVHEESYRKLGNAGRLRLALELSDLTHSLAAAGLRRRKPEFSDEAARKELAERLYLSSSAL